MGGMANLNRKQIEQVRSTEAEAQAFIAENEPLLERATPETLHRIVLHGGEIAVRLAEEVVAEMEEKAGVLNASAEAIRNPETPPARIQEVEEERMRVRAQESTKQQTHEALSSLLTQAIALCKRRESEQPDAYIVEVPDPPEGPIAITRKAEQPKRGFWRRLVGGG